MVLRVPKQLGHKYNLFPTPKSGRRVCSVSSDSVVTELQRDWRREEQPESEPGSVSVPTQTVSLVWPATPAPARHCITASGQLETRQVAG